MNFRIPSSSSLPLVHRCAASFALPHLGGNGTNTRSRMGDCLHEHMDDRAKFGVTSAMERLELIARAHELSPTEESIFLARARHFDWCPPKGSFGEVALALLEDGSVVRITGGKGRYDWPEGTVTGGTLDLMWSESEPLDLSDPEHPRCPPNAVLWCPDVKTGDEAWVEPVEVNRQILTNAMLAALWTGARFVVPGVIYWRKGQGEWDLPMTPDGKVAPWSMAQLRAHERSVRADMAAVKEQQRRALAGEPLQMKDGDWCQFCPGKAACSVHTALLRNVASGTVVLPGAAPLTHEERAWLASRLGAAERFVKQWREALIADVKANGPIPMADGNLWGAHPGRPKKTVVIDKAMPVLREELGELAEMAVKKTMPKETLEDAARELIHAQGKTKGVSPIVRRVYAKLGEAGALVEEPGVSYGPHKPKSPDLAMDDPDVEDLE